MFLHFYRDGTVLLVASTCGIALYDLCSGECIRRDTSYGPLALAAWEEETDTLLTVCGKPTESTTMSEENSAQATALTDMNVQFEMFLGMEPNRCVVVTYNFLSEERMHTSITTEGPVTHAAINPLHLMLFINGSLCLYSRNSLEPIASLEQSGLNYEPGEFIPVSLSAVRVWQYAEELGDPLFHNHEIPHDNGKVSFVAVSSRPMPKKKVKLSSTGGAPTAKVRRDVLIACVPCRSFQPLTTFIISDAHQEGIAALSFSPTAEFIVTASKRGTIIRLFLVPEGAPLRTLRRGHTSAEVHAFAFSSNVALLAVLTSSSTLHVFSTEVDPVTSKAASETEHRSVSKVTLPSTLLSSSSPQHGSAISFMNPLPGSGNELLTLSLAIPSKDALVVHRFREVEEKYEYDERHSLTLRL